MKKKKILFGLFLFVCSAISCSSVSDEDTLELNENIEKIHVCCMAPGIREGLERVERKINEKTVSEIGVEVDLILFDDSEYFSKYQMITSGAENVDMITSFFNLATESINQGLFMPLNSYIDQYGQDLRAMFTDEEWNSTLISGEAYGIPTDHEVGWLVGYQYNKDITDELGIDMTYVDTFEEWGKVLEKVHHAYPEMYGIAATYGGNLYNAMPASNDWDILTDGLGVIMYGENHCRVVNLFETEAFKKQLELYRSWYEKGYIQPNIATSYASFKELFDDRKAFSTFVGSDVETWANYQLSENPKMGFVTIGKNKKYSYSLMRNQWNVLADSKHPEACIKFLNLLAKDKELANLMMYGEENVDYIVNEAGKLCAIDNTVDPYFVSVSLPNKKILSDWEGTISRSEIYEKQNNFDASIASSPAYGFVFDGREVASQITACQTILKKYNGLFQNGVIDVDLALPQFCQELKDAGIDAVIREKQRQYSAFLKNKG